MTSPEAADEDVVSDTPTPKSSPRRIALRDSAHKAMRKQAGKMKERASRKNGWDLVLPVGTVVHVVMLLFFFPATFPAERHSKEVVASRAGLPPRPLTLR